MTDRNAPGVGPDAEVAAARAALASNAMASDEILGAVHAGLARIDDGDPLPSQARGRHEDTLPGLAVRRPDAL